MSLVLSTCGYSFVLIYNPFSNFLTKNVYNNNNNVYTLIFLLNQLPFILVPLVGFISDSIPIYKYR